MQKIQNYTILEQVTETRSSLIYRGHKESSEDSVIIKALKTINPTPSEIARFRQEYKLIKDLNIPGIIKVLDLIEYESGVALVLEDFDSVSIKSLLEDKKQFDFKSFLDIAIKITDALASLHEREIVHRDIKPHNILINEDTENVKITDFGIASELTHENDAIYNPEVIEGSLAYMSPEQTGRMNRTVDYRTDIYSLGVTLYEIITGLPPFVSEDPMTIIHSHIAVMPVSPQERNPEIPKVISDIIMKLLSKNIEDRYQNGFSLVADLEECRKLLAKNGTIESFDLARYDISNRFIMPQKLFGREHEIDTLLSGFEKLCTIPETQIATGKGQGVEMMLVAGDPGIGKSALINEIHKPIVKRCGYFISGKYEQYRREKPYSAIIQAFQGLIKQILAETNEKIHIWKENILEALGPNGKVITEIIPDVELIIGEQPEPAELDPEESRNRFKFVFEKFASVFPTFGHPVVMFLDDLQWADIPSMRLIKTMATSPDINYLYVIGAYRDNEVGETHPLTDTIHEIEKVGIQINRINLGPILEDDIKNLIMNFLKCADRYGLLLASLVHEKTGGNPFFVIQFLETLYTEKLIEFDAGLGWIWDIDRVNLLQVTDNVVDLLVGKINRLPDTIQEVLKICAAIGNWFDLETLSFVLGYSIDEVLGDLTVAINEGLVTLSSEKDRYLFQHDRIQEAAYSLVSENEKAALHYRIGRKALDKAFAENDFERRLFYIADQLNLGSLSITDTKEREELVRLNLDAGIKAKASSAFAPAIQYLETGIQLLDNNSWRKQYELILSLYTEATEAACLNGDYDKMNELSAVALEHAKTTLDKVKIISSIVNARRSQEDFQGSINAALPILKLLGVRIPKKPTRLHVGIELLKMKIALLRKKPEDLLNLPEMTNPKAIASIQILAGMGFTAFFENPNILALAILKGARQSIRYGNGPDNAFGYAGYGIILAAGLWDFDGAIEFGKLGLKLIDRLGARKQLCKTLFAYNAISKHWKIPLKDTVAPLHEGYRIGLETGDIDYATFSLLMGDVHALFSGKDLSELANDLAKHNQIISGYNMKYILTLNLIQWQGVLNVLGQNDDPLKLTGNVIKGEDSVPLWIRENNRAALAVFYFTRLTLRSIYSEYYLVLEDALMFKKYQSAMQGVVINRFKVFFESVAMLMVYHDVALLKKIKYRIQVIINQLKMKKWANSAPENSLHKYHVIEALRAWHIRKDIDRAEKEFKQAVRLCKRPDDFMIESITTELIARFYSFRGEKEKEKKYLIAACGILSGWSAEGKLKQLRYQYPEILEDKALAFGNSALGTDTGTGLLSEVLDLSTVIKASQAISGEIVLEKLLVTMIEITMENAGADRGLILLKEKEDLLVEAEKVAGSDEVTLLESIPVGTHSGLSPNIVNYVARTKEMLILNDAVNEGPFSSEHYILENRPKSILCMPVIHQGRLRGVLYLENNISTGAFTPDRLELLNVISSQIAISIDNAKLYENLEAKVEERTEALRKVMDELEIMNENLIDTNEQLADANKQLAYTNKQLAYTNEQLADTNKQLEDAHQIAQIDMNMAINVQSSLFPAVPPESPHWDISFTFKPMSGVSGDLYDFYVNDGEVKGLVLLDVSGHGIASGLITMTARSIFDRNFKGGGNDELNHVVGKANKDLISEIGIVGNYLTGILLRFKGDVVEYVNAGHGDLICKRASSDIVEIIGDEDPEFKGAILGVESLDLPYKMLAFELERGDALLLYSDCLNESTDSDGEEYGEERINSSFENAPGGSAESIIDYILNDFYEFVGDKPANDDLTVIVLKKI